MFNVVIVRYGEIGTKSRQTRKWFENILMNNIREALISEGINFKKVEAKHGRILVRTNEAREAAGILRRVFGIVSLSPAMEVEAELGKINKIALKLFRKKKRELGIERPRFRVTARRITKEFPLKSPEIQAKVGEYIFENEESEVNLHNYDIEVGVELMEGKAYIFVDKIRAWGGLPIGTQGKVVALLSDVESSVAAFLMMKRGVEIIPLHIYKDEETLEKARRIWGKLKRYHYGGKAELIVVKQENWEGTLKKLREIGKEEHAPILWKFLMVERADETAKEFGAKGIAMGDSLQGTCQTLESIYIVNQASDLPIYWPLIGFRREEIVELSKKIGTFELSALPEDEIPLKHPTVSWDDFREIYRATFGRKPKKRTPR